MFFFPLEKLQSDLYSDMNFTTKNL